MEDQDASNVLENRAAALNEAERLVNNQNRTYTMNGRIQSVHWGSWFQYEEETNPFIGQDKRIATKRSRHREVRQQAIAAGKPSPYKKIKSLIFGLIATSPSIPVEDENSQANNLEAKRSPSLRLLFSRRSLRLEDNRVWAYPKIKVMRFSSLREIAANRRRFQHNQTNAKLHARDPVVVSVALSDNEEVIDLILAPDMRHGLHYDPNAEISLDVWFYQTVCEIFALPPDIHGDPTAVHDYFASSDLFEENRDFLVDFSRSGPGPLWPSEYDPIQSDVCWKGGVRPYLRKVWKAASDSSEFSTAISLNDA